MFENVSSKIHSAKIVPVVKLENSLSALKLAEALCKGGFSAMEITFRTLNKEEGFKHISECIKVVAKEFPDLLLGAGTVINPHLAEIAAESGAEFIVSPGFNVPTVDWCIKNELAVFPGVCTPSEVETALMYGLSVLKYFPAEICGGPKMLKALAGPFPQVKFIATGGINESNLKSYLELKNVHSVGGSWMVKEDLINSENWQEIINISQRAFKIAGAS